MSAEWMVAGVVLAMVLHGPTSLAAAQDRPAVPIILDTDIESDVDDVGTLAMLHALADRGEVEILGIGVSAKNPQSAAVVDRINTYFGRPDLPIGNVKGEGVDRESRYAAQVAEEFPGDLESGDEAANAVEVYRQILAGQPDNSVVIVTVGYITNLRNLLASGPDKHSDLGGWELVDQKVQLWVCMGGQFPEGIEANLRWDAPSSAEVVKNWPTDIIFSGWEIGHRVFTGKRLGELPESSPIRRSYELFNGLKPHHSWDQVALLYAVRGINDGPASDYWDLSAPGRIVVDPESGRNTWEEDPTGTHRHKLSKRDRNLIAQEIDDLMMHLPQE